MTLGQIIMKVGLDSTYIYYQIPAKLTYSLASAALCSLVSMLTHKYKMMNLLYIHITLSEKSHCPMIVLTLAFSSDNLRAPVFLCHKAHEEVLLTNTLNQDCILTSPVRRQKQDICFKNDELSLLFARYTSLTFNEVKKVG